MLYNDPCWFTLCTEKVIADIAFGYYGTNWLGRFLGQEPYWVVEAEPDKYIGPCKSTVPRRGAIELAELATGQIIEVRRSWHPSRLWVKLKPPKGEERILNFDGGQRPKEGEYTTLKAGN